MHLAPQTRPRQTMRSMSRWLSIAIAACSMLAAAPLAAADDAFIRASAGILMSRNMSVKDRVEAADSLARHEPRAAVPILIEALNETSEPVRRAAARGLWTIAQNDDARGDGRGSRRDARAARRARRCQRVGRDERGGALERLGEPAAALADVRRKALRTPGPLAYERFLAARGLIGLDPAPALTPYVLEWLFDEHRRAATPEQRRRARQHSHRECRVDTARPIRRPRRPARARARVARRSTGDRRSPPRDGARDTAAGSFRADRWSPRRMRRRRRPSRPPTN